MSSHTQTTRKPDPMNVQTFEDIIILLQEAEEIGGETDAKEAYLRGKKYIDNYKF